jgi:hypothetical protein
MFNWAKKFRVRLLKNREINEYAIYDKVLVSSGDKDYEFIPTPEGWLCIVSNGKMITSCYLPDPQHKLQFEVVDKKRELSPPLALLGLKDLTGMEQR